MFLNSSKPQLELPKKKKKKKNIRMSLPSCACSCSAQTRPPGRCAPVPGRSSRGLRPSSPG